MYLDRVLYTSDKIIAPKQSAWWYLCGPNIKKRTLKHLFWKRGSKLLHGYISLSPGQLPNISSVLLVTFPVFGGYYYFSWVASDGQNWLSCWMMKGCVGALLGCARDWLHHLKCLQYPSWKRGKGKQSKCKWLFFYCSLKRLLVFLDVRRGWGGVNELHFLYSGSLHNMWKEIATT